MKKGPLASPGQVLRAYKCFRFSFKIKGKSVGSLVSWRLLARTAPEYGLPIFIWLLRIKGGRGGAEGDSRMVVLWFSLTLYKILKSRLPREGVHMDFGPPARLPCHLASHEIALPLRSSNYKRAAPLQWLRISVPHRNPPGFHRSVEGRWKEFHMRLLVAPDTMHGLAMPRRAAYRCPSSLALQPLNTRAGGSPFLRVNILKVCFLIASVTACHHN